MMARPDELTSSLPIGGDADEHLAELAVGLDGGGDAAHLALDLAGADEADARRLVHRQFRQVLRRHHAHEINSLRAMSVNSASPRGEAGAPITAVELRIVPATGEGHQDRAAFGQREPGEILPGGDGLAGVGQDLRDLQAGPVRPHHRLLARNEDAECFDQIGEAEYRSLQHRHRRALRGVLRGGAVGGEGWGGEQEEGGRERGEVCSRVRGQIIHRTSRGFPTVDSRRRGREPSSSSAISLPKVGS